MHKFDVCFFFAHVELNLLNYIHVDLQKKKKYITDYATDCFMLHKLFDIPFYSIPYYSSMTLLRVLGLPAPHCMFPSVKVSASEPYRPRYVFAAGEAVTARMHISTEHFRNSVLKMSILLTQISNS